MYLTEYWIINKETRLAVRGVILYKEKWDLVERKPEPGMLAIYVYQPAFPKRSQRKNIWKKMCRTESPLRINFHEVSYFMEDVKFGKSNLLVSKSDILALKKRLSSEQVKIFDKLLQFYYEK